MALKLSPRTQRLIESIFDSKDVAEASQWIADECGDNLPLCKGHDEYQMERIRFAALKLSEGNISKLLRAIDLASRDWRDLLMAADFGSDLNAHETWAKEILKS